MKRSTKFAIASVVMITISGAFVVWGTDDWKTVTAMSVFAVLSFLFYSRTLRLTTQEAAAQRIPDMKITNVCVEASNVDFSMYDNVTLYTVLAIQGKPDRMALLKALRSKVMITNAGVFNMYEVITGKDGVVHSSGDIRAAIDKYNNTI